MKFLPAQLSYLLSERQARQSALSLLRYIAFLGLVIGLCTVLFHVIMLYAEGRDYSWVTGFYWTLTVMTTLGFGDITFHSDIGRLFSIVVLLSGVILLLIVLPFAFIRLFFAPWLEAQVRLTAPRSIPPETRNHVIVCGWDAIAPGLARRLRLHGIDHFVVEPDPVRAARLHADGVSVVAGEVDARETYEELRLKDARLLLANREDTVNTNVILTARELTRNLPILATADEEDSIDILELSGCTQVLPLKRRLGELLARRINTGHAQSHVIGTFHDLLVAEFTVHKTGFAGGTLREAQLEQNTGVKAIGIWEGGHLHRANPETALTDRSVVLVLGTAAQIQELDLLLVIYDTNYNPALVIGGGKVGRAAVRELRRLDFPVHVVERDPHICQALEHEADQVFHGEAADREVLQRAGITDAPAVVLTTNDDAVNIYLSIYCRRLNPELRIVSRITHHRNVEAIHRAGADFVVSYSSLGIEHVMAHLRGADLVLLAEKVELFSLDVPQSLAGQTLQRSGLADEFGLNVIAIQTKENLEINPLPTTLLPANGELVILGDSERREAFYKRYS